MIKTVAVYQTADGIINPSGGGGAGGGGACTHYWAKLHQRIGGSSEILNMDTFGWVGVPGGWKGFTQISFHKREHQRSVILTQYMRYSHSAAAFCGDGSNADFLFFFFFSCRTQFVGGFQQHPLHPSQFAKYVYCIFKDRVSGKY